MLCSLESIYCAYSIQTMCLSQLFGQNSCNAPWLWILLFFVTVLNCIEIFPQWVLMVVQSALYCNTSKSCQQNGPHCMTQLLPLPICLFFSVSVVCK